VAAGRSSWTHSVEPVRGHQVSRGIEPSRLDVGSQRSLTAAGVSIDQPLDAPGEGRIAGLPRGGEGQARALEGLEDVRVVVDATLEAAVQPTGRPGEVGEAAGPLALIEAVRDGHAAVGLEPGSDQVVVELDRRRRHRQDRRAATGAVGVLHRLAGLVEGEQLDAAELHGVALGLEGDPAAGEDRISAGLEQPACVGVAVVELRAVVAQDDGVADEVADRPPTVDLDFHRHPLVAVKGLRGRVHAVPRDERAVHLDVRAGRAEVGGGARLVAVAAEELDLDRHREGLVLAHRPRILGVDHHAAVALGPAGSALDLLADEAVLDAEPVALVRHPPEEMAEAALEAVVPAVVDLDRAVLDEERRERIVAERLAGDPDLPAGEVAAVEEFDPAVPVSIGAGNGRRRRCELDGQCGEEDDDPAGEPTAPGVAKNGRGGRSRHARLRDWLVDEGRIEDEDPGELGACRRKPTGRRAAGRGRRRSSRIRRDEPTRADEASAGRYAEDMPGLFDGTPLERPVTCSVCERPLDECTCPRDASGDVRLPRDQPARVRREKRRGKVVTVVAGLDPVATDLPALLEELRRGLGAGGTVTGEADERRIELQGDHRDVVVERLVGLGYPAKLAGG